MRNSTCKKKRPKRVYPLDKFGHWIKAGKKRLEAARRKAKVKKRRKP